MHSPETSDEDLLREAIQRILPPGIKPEDYLQFGQKWPFEIAQIVADEFLHLQSMRDLRKQREAYSRAGILDKFLSKFSWR